jgi:hypothetical protein
MSSAIQTFLLDDQEISFTPGQSVMQAALTAGVFMAVLPGLPLPA